MALKFSKDQCDSTCNLLTSPRNDRSALSSDFVIPMDTGTAKHGYDIPIERVKYEPSRNSLNIQIQVSPPENQHNDENNLFHYGSPSAVVNNDGQNNVKSVEILEPKNKCELHRPKKLKLVGRIIPLLGNWRRTNNKSENKWSKILNRICHLNTDLLEAIEKQNNINVDRILKAGANPNATCRLSHVTACHAAAFASSGALRLLLECGANTDRRDKFGRTPLHCAVWAGRIETIAMLLNFNENLQNKVMFQLTPEAEEEIKELRHRWACMIDEPCKQSDIKILRQMWRDRIEHNCKRFMTQIPKFFPGWTALHIASYAAHHDATRLLLAAGANPNSRDAMEQTPLDVAGAACYLESTRINMDEYVKTIKILIDVGGKLNVSDTSSNSALHTAVELSSVEATQMLLKAGAPVSHLNDEGNTPLHECVTKRCKELLQVLISHDRLGHVVNSSGHTVLQTAILASWVPGVCITLDAGADVTFVAHDGETAIHIAARHGNLDILNEILRNAAQYPNAINYDNGHTEPPIFCAIRSGNIECVKALLKAGAILKMTCYVVSKFGKHRKIVPNPKLDQKPLNLILHATAEIGSEDMLELLLKHDQSLEELLCYKCPYLENMLPVEFAAYHNKFNSFRFLLQKTLQAMLNLQQSFDHSRLLYIINKNEQTYYKELIKQIPNALQTGNIKKNYYPLHDAAYSGNRNRILHLIDNGADLSEQDKNGNTAISLVIDNISKPTEFLAKLFDDYISTNTVSTSTEYEITIDYRVLTPPTDNSSDKNDQMRVVTALLETKDRQNQRELLAHPLVESFLYLKWKSLSTYFYLMVLFYFMFVMSLSVHTVSVFYYKDKYNKTMLHNGIVPRVWDVHIWQYIIYFTLVFVAIQELSCLNLSSKTWAMNIFTVEFLVKFITYSLAIATPLVISMEYDIDAGQLDWQRQLATMAIVVAWLNIMMMITKIPVSGKFIEMFWIVLVQVIEVFVTFSSLILMFSFCFMIQFHSQTPFEGPWASVAKTLVMMTSEFDYDDTFTRQKAQNLSTPIQLLRFVFVIFLVLTAIVLMNLMIGVAVDDVQNLAKVGNIKRLEKQVAFLNRLEVSRRRKKSILHSLGIHRWFKCKDVSQTVTFKPVNNDKCQYSSSIKEAIVNKVQEQIAKKEREAEWSNLEPKLEKHSQDISDKLKNISDILEMKLEALSNDMQRHISEMKSKLEHLQLSKH